MAGSGGAGSAGAGAGQCDAGGSCGSAGDMFGNAGTSGSADAGAGNGGAAGTRPVTIDGAAQCADTTVRSSRVTPTVMLLVDQSSSMTDDFGGAGSRWDVLRNFLLDEPDGLIADLQGQVRFGLALYSAVSGGDNPEPMGECPMITNVAPAIDNFAAISAVYSEADVIEDTPTGDSIDAVVDSLDLNAPDRSNDPVVIILATDGEPDRCEALDPQEGQAESIAAAERAFSLGVRTYIISVGNEVSVEHQQDMANAGLGRAAGDPDAEFWEAGDDATLRAALTEIVGSQLNCEVRLNGMVESGDACEGVVMLNGNALPCGDDNGWELADPKTIRVLGTACEEMKSGGDLSLEVSFPCTVNFVD